MTPFEFVFSLVGLLLGFSLVEVLGGLGKAVKARRKVSIGLLTPLLGLVVMLDLTSFWIIVWQARAAIPPTFEALMFSLLVTGIYYLAAILVFPDRPEEWESLDAYYPLHRRQIIAGVVACNILAHGANIAVGGEPPVDAPRLGLFILFYGLLAGAAFAPGKKTGIACLAGLIALYVGGGLAVRLLT
jgi:hypothetical protein